MLLAIDAGNTNVVFAILEGREIRARWRIATEARRTGIRSTQRTASSRSSHSSTMYPANCSFDSAKGPSVMDTSPSVDRMTLADDAGWSPAANTQAPSDWSSALKALTWPTMRCASSPLKSTS